MVAILGHLLLKSAGPDTSQEVNGHRATDPPTVKENHIALSYMRTQFTILSNIFCLFSLFGLYLCSRSVVMIDSNATVNGSTVWVSAGAEYNNEEEIWIGQASFEVIDLEFVSIKLKTFINH